MRFEGIYTPLVTPFRGDGGIDHEALEALVGFLVSAGVHGLVVAGTTGEYYAQSFEERVAVMARVREVAAGRLPVVVGTGAIRTEDSVALAAAAREAGADALLVATPPYAMPTDREIAAHVRAVDAAAGLPIMLYNYPGRMGVNMGSECLDILSGTCPNVVAIKESSGEIDRLHMLARDYPRIAIACGMDDQALEFFAWGARAWVCAGSNFAPEAHVALWQACAVEGDFARGRRIMSAMLPLMRLLERGGRFVQCIKQGVTLRGIEAGPPRRPLLPLEPEEQLALARVLETMQAELAAAGVGA